MRTARMLLSIIAMALLCLGYAASQWAAFSGQATPYAAKIDCPSVQWLALALLAVCVVFAFIKDEKADES